MDNAKIIAVDFDGTLVENKWPEIGAPIEKNIAKVKAEQEPRRRTFGKSTLVLQGAGHPPRCCQ